MSTLTIHTPDTARGQAAEILTTIRDEVGFVPNMFGVMGGTPVALAAFDHINRAVARSSLSPAEAAVVQTAASVANRSPYCVAAHTALAAKAGVDASLIAAVREEEALADPRLEALRHFTERLVEGRGHLGPEEVDAFKDAGFHRDQVVEVIMVVASRFFSNLMGNVARLPLDDAFAPFEWGPPEERVTAA